jgi:hypothetical protein
MIVIKIPVHKYKWVENGHSGLAVTGLIYFVLLLFLSFLFFFFTSQMYSTGLSKSFESFMVWLQSQNILFIYLCNCFTKLTH